MLSYKQSGKNITILFGKLNLTRLTVS